MEELKRYIKHFIDINKEEWEEFSSLFVPVYYKKGEHIYGKSESSEALYFMTEGIVRSYKLGENGKDFTWTFHCLEMAAISYRIFIDIAVVDYVSFTQGTAETLAFEVLVDAKLMKIKKDDLLALYARNPKWKMLEVKMLEESHTITQQRTFQLLTKNAKERLLLLENTFPNLFKKNVPLEHIASYLGITRQSLNRLRRLNNS